LQKRWEKRASQIGMLEEEKLGGKEGKEGR
jgi:hypothetical protein